MTKERGFYASIALCVGSRSRLVCTKETTRYLLHSTRDESWFGTETRPTYPTVYVRLQPEDCSNR